MVGKSSFCGHNLGLGSYNRLKLSWIILYKHLFANIRSQLTQKKTYPSRDRFKVFKGQNFPAASTLLIKHIKIEFKNNVTVIAVIFLLLQQL